LFERCFNFFLIPPLIPKLARKQLIESNFAFFLKLPELEYLLEHVINASVENELVFLVFFETEKGLDQLQQVVDRIDT